MDKKAHMFVPFYPWYNDLFPIPLRYDIFWYVHCGMVKEKWWNDNHVWHALISATLQRERCPLVQTLTQWQVCTRACFLSCFCRLTTEQLRKRTEYENTKYLLQLKRYFIDTDKCRLKTKARNTCHGEIFLRNKVLFIFCWIIWSAEGDKSPKLWGSIIQLWSSIIQFMEQHFKLCSSIWIMGLHHHL